MSEHTELEDRLRTAVHAHAAGVEADDRSLDAIRTRVRTAKHRRRAIVAGAASPPPWPWRSPCLGSSNQGDIETIDNPGPTTITEPPRPRPHRDRNPHRQPCRLRRA